MPSSYNFSSSPPVEVPTSSSSYRASTSPQPPKPPPTSNTNDKTKNKNNDKENKNKASNKATTTRETNNAPATASSNKTNKELDPDAKWRANYVPSPLGDHSKGPGAANNGSSSAANNGVSVPDNDPRDAKWKANYVPAPYDGLKSHHPEAGLSASNATLLTSKSCPAQNRNQWGSKAEFVLACTGFSIGIGNVIRFPYLVYNYGGGAFVLVYVFFLLLVGLPMYLLELGLGQYARAGPLGVWGCSGAMRGIGVSMVILTLLSSVYYAQVMAYCLHYVVAALMSIGDKLPWSTCNHAWTPSEYCYDVVTVAGNTTVITATQSLQSAAQYYFKHKVLHQPILSAPSDDLGLIRWDLMLCMMAAWFTVFLVVMKGVRSLGKVACVSTTLSVIALITIMINGVMMKGAKMGLVYLFVPQWSALSSLAVWQAALQHVLFSLSLSIGGVIVYGSHNTFRNKVHFDAVGICLVDLIVSIVSSVAVFSVLGAMANSVGVPVAKLPDIDHSLAFVSYPTAISASLPLPHLWTVVFFMTIFVMGVTTLSGFIVTLTSSLQDCLVRLRSSDLVVGGALCCCCFLLGLPLCAENRGHFLMNLISFYGLGTSVLVVALCELVTVSWLYGVRRISEDFAYMLGYTPSMFWRVCWAFVSPVAIVVVLVFSIFVFEDPSYEPTTEPYWASLARWFLALVSVAWIPLVFVGMLGKTICTRSLTQLFAPALSWGPGDPQARRELLAARSAGDAANGGIDNPAMAYGGE